MPNSWRCHIFLANFLFHHFSQFARQKKVFLIELRVAIGWSPQGASSSNDVNPNGKTENGTLCLKCGTISHLYHSTYLMFDARDTDFDFVAIDNLRL